MTYKHKQLSTKLVGADFSVPRVSFSTCVETPLRCAEIVEVSVSRMVSQIIKFSNHQIFKSSNN